MKELKSKAEIVESLENLKDELSTRNDAKSMEILFKINSCLYSEYPHLYKTDTTVDLRTCEEGDILISKHGWELTYVEPLTEENYMDHYVKYPNGSGGTRTHDGKVARKRPLETDHDIVKIIKLKR